jgi:hypothetical protein
VTDIEHLPAERIAAYLAQELPPAEQRLVQEHLVACRECRGDMVEAARVVDRRRPRWPAVVAPLAAAAILVLLLVPRPETGADREVMRGSVGEGITQFPAVAPSADGRMSIDSLAFVGDVVWTATTPDTVLVPPRGIAWRRGGHYFWYVDALLDGARSSTTGVLEFTIRP